MTRRDRARSDTISHGGDDGVKIVVTPGVRKSVWLVAGAMALIALAVLALVHVAGAPNRAEDAAPPPSAAPPPATTVSAAPVRAREPQAKSAASPHARRIPAPDTQSPPIDPARVQPARPDEPPSREDAPFGFGKPGEKSGVDLFPSMGTKPIKIGIVVPDDFELPEGYVRHFQANEDGQLLPAILLFHPDYEWVDEAGEAIPLPPDRVVPPELAPPGLPIQMLEVPQPQREPGGAR